MVWEYLGQFWDKIAGATASTTADIFHIRLNFFKISEMLLPVLWEVFLILFFILFLI